MSIARVVKLLKRSGFLVIQAHIEPFRWVSFKDDNCILLARNMKGADQYLDVIQGFNLYRIYVYSGGDSKWYRYDREAKRLRKIKIPHCVEFK